MKRYSILLIALALVLITAGASFAVFPESDGSATFNLQQGWFGPGIPVWFICTDTSDVRFATTQHLTLAPKLSRGFYGAGVAAAFIVTNPKESQGPVFETIPGNNLYSGIWRIRLVTWIDLSARVPLISIGQILALKTAGKLDYVESEIRVDYPIIAVGRLGCPFTTTPPLSYTLPQVKSIDFIRKTVKLPTWKVYCADFFTLKAGVVQVIIPDAGDAALASTLGANLAPQLLNWGLNPFQLAGTERFWVFRSPKPADQFPVIEDCPTSCSVANKNFDYSPVGRYTILHRNIAASTVVNNPTYLNQLLGTGLILVQQNQFINAPVICPPILIK